MIQIHTEWGQFNITFTLIFLFLYWYHAHHPINWIISHIKVWTATRICPTLSMEYGHHSRVQGGGGRWAKIKPKEVVQATASHSSSNFKTGIMFVFQFLGHLSYSSQSFSYNQIVSYSSSNILWVIPDNSLANSNIMSDALCVLWARQQAWNRNTSQKRNTRGPLNLSFTLIFYFSNWYYAHLPIFWVISQISSL